MLAISAVRKSKVKQPPKCKEWPKVTIQLPLYNEPFVVERLLAACEKIDYPLEKIEIQVLDDSTDETSKLITNFIENSNNSSRFKHIRRRERVGFKAGALDFGLNCAQGEFIAIFDADFVPEVDFLRKTIPFFKDSKIGVVQTRWGHLNEDESLITRAQAIMLNTHFSIEQLGRTSQGAFINFNGTAGVWRRSCIDDAGGWHADTLTEDLDLSYRAQVKNWKFEYLFDVISPAELPNSFGAFQTQQYRWSKGAAECLNKNIGLLATADISFKKKVFGLFHLMNSSIYLLVFLLLLISPLVYFILKSNPSLAYEYRYFSPIGSVVMVLLIVVFFVGHFAKKHVSFNRIIWFFPSIVTFFSMTTGISVLMTKGVIAGLRRKSSEFVRTPKLGESGISERKRTKVKFGMVNAFEVIFWIYGLFTLYRGFVQLNIGVILYGLILTIGFSLNLFFANWTWKR